MRPPLATTPADRFAIGEFLRSADLSPEGLDAPTLRLWMDLDPDGRIIATTGFELVGTEALVRSVAVAPQLRRAGRGTELARFALQEATAGGAQRAWLMSRRSGEFWQKLGFVQSDIHLLAAAVLDTGQVRAFEHSGQLFYETAWVRPLP